MRSLGAGELAGYERKVRKKCKAREGEVFEKKFCCLFPVYLGSGMNETPTRTHKFYSTSVLMVRKWKEKRMMSAPKPFW